MNSKLTVRVKLAIILGLASIVISLWGVYVEATTDRRWFEVEEFLAIFRGEVHREFLIVSSMILGIILLLAGFTSWRNNRKVTRIGSYRSANSSG